MGNSEDLGGVHPEDRSGSERKEAKMMQVNERKKIELFSGEKMLVQAPGTPSLRLLGTVTWTV